MSVHVWKLRLLVSYGNTGNCPWLHSCREVPERNAGVTSGSARIGSFRSTAAGTNVSRTRSTVRRRVAVIGASFGVLGIHAPGRKTSFV
ncbi:MAG: hypothetical protein ACJ74I_01440 [Gaiellaceae bacterium]